ncbi:T9SS type A sorting domain-containing protein [bacterium]|nr:T9SS type A sorting domain-containing protein [bacterium]
MNRWVLLLFTIFIMGLSLPGWTASPTLTETATPTPTLSPTSTPSYQFWRDDFEYGLPGAQPPGWRDDTVFPNYNADIAYTEQFSIAAVSRTADSTWGKVESPEIYCNTSVYSHVEVRVIFVSPSTAWKIGIQEINGAWQYRDLCSSQSNTGIFVFNYATVMGWTGMHQYYIQLTVEGLPGTAFEVDFVAIREPPPTPTPTVTLTFTNTATPSVTVTPTRTITTTFTPSATNTQTQIHTLTFTNTPTSTNTPYYSPTVTPSPTASSTPTSTLTCTPTWPITKTRTMTPTPVIASTSVPSITLTSTPTLIPTSTPFVEEKQVAVYPNPARSKVNFAYTISGAGKVVIDIYKLTGERVANITEHVNGGTGQTLSTAWNAVNVAPGIYFCRIVITDGSGKVILNQKKKVALIR